ncbi:uncharacterized protein N7496_007267 [Penicillium cataractarum]|uniref:Uncharacterized protein n=1 Tax=Penicillium cataractarum TaxID=2100454 RepID=A0A9W9S4H5_9EURO|nr:uncharacterized protein N7496_007267 [Penicillium cataractarum]KAJ5371175.1 hypothetical protein N7496_007267 [Penicillium cataractarum]
MAFFVRALENRYRGLSREREKAASIRYYVDQSLCYLGLLFFDLKPRGPLHSDQGLWDEYVLAYFGFIDMHVEWKKLLRERLDVYSEAHENAKAFWTDMCNLRQYPNLDEKGQQTLERLF